MRDSPYRVRMPATVILMIATGVAFALQMINAVYLKTAAVDYLALSASGLQRGFLWQFLTFQFLHGGLFHLLGNLLGLWFLGRFIEDRLGPGRMLALYFLSGAIGGMFQAALMFAFPAHFGSLLVGASAGVFGLLAAFCLMEPEGQILVFFMFPIRARYLLMFALGITLFFVIVPADPIVAHAAHLGGLLAGIAYVHWRLYLWQPSFRWPSLPRRRSSGKILKVRFPKSSSSASPSPRRSNTSEEFISQEVDPILEKLHAHGVQSLTPREREILEAASKRLGKR